jgi:hypothetical protein
MKLAMSPAIPNRQIGYTDDPDRPGNINFAEKPFHLAKVMP